MSFASSFLAAYVVLGMGTTTALWSTMQDELDLALSLEFDDDEHIPAIRLVLSVLFVLAWPIVFWDAFSRRP